MKDAMDLISQFKLILPFVAAIAFIFIILVIHSVNLFKRKKYFKGGLRAILSIVVLGVLVSFGVLFATLLKYRILLKKYNIATVKITPYEGGFVYNHYSKMERIPTFHRKFKGERFSVEAVFIDFKEGLEVLGLRPMLFLTSVRSLDRNGLPLQEVDFGTDWNKLTWLCKNYEKFPFFEKVYISGAGQFKRSEATFWLLKYSTDGLFLELRDE